MMNIRAGGGGGRKGVLEPVERFSEILFGLIMVLTFTCSIGAAEGSGGAGREEVRTMLIASLACNLAWGLIDGVMYLFAGISERGREMLIVRAVREATSDEAARRAIVEALPPFVAEAMGEAEVENVRRRIRESGEATVGEPPPLPPLPRVTRVTREDLRGAGAVFLLVVAATFPVVLPFIFIPDDATRALRLSNAIACVMLFVGGYRLGKHIGHRSPLLFGTATMLIGIVLVAITIALGG